MVLNDDPNNGVVFSPFAVEGGQVFIADAMIKKATIAQALIGQSIASSALTVAGKPVMDLDFNAGQITIQKKNTDGRYIIMREDGIFGVSGGVTIFELVM